MPTYDYECKQCDKIFEVFQSITAEKLDKCPTCDFKIRRLIGTGSGIIFKGTGFYHTDYKNKGLKPSSNNKSNSDKANSANSNSSDKPSSNSTKEKSK